MAELYWLSLTLDIPFSRYEDDPLVTAAVSDLNAFSSRAGAQPAKAVSPETLFRGHTPRDLVGPYISQFLWLEIPYGIKKIDQRYEFPKRGQQSGCGSGTLRLRRKIPLLLERRV